MYRWSEVNHIFFALILDSEEHKPYSQYACGGEDVYSPLLLLCAVNK
jgi:hypothetical protein